MKKLLCLLMAMLVLFSFAACGGEGETKDKDSAGSKAPTGEVTVKFDAESYTVGVEEYITLKDHVTVSPADTTLKFDCTDITVAEIFSASKGEFKGAKTGEVTVTVTAGNATATCKLIVAGLGTIVHRDGNEGGITNKRWGAVERPDDDKAYVVVIPKNLAAGTDMSKIVTLAVGDKLADGSSVVAANGYYVAKTGDTGNYTFENVPEGDYVGLIISGMDYTTKKSYDKATAVATFKASTMAKYFTDAEIDNFVELFYNREFYVSELTVTANQKTIFGHCFEPDMEQ